MKVSIVDYGGGNIASVIKAIEYAGAEAQLVSTPEDILKADKLLLPGVGAAGKAIENLKENNLDLALNEAVLKKGIPIMGICVGMQLMAEELHEFGQHKGLGWIKGKVIHLGELGIQKSPIPHIGWNDVIFSESLKKLSSKLGRHKAFYFAHSYALETSEKDLINSRVQYEQEVTAGISLNNIVAFQFHPEKSQLSGDTLLQWFLEWSP